jgi:hypothetical protein
MKAMKSISKGVLFVFLLGAALNSSGQKKSNDRDKQYESEYTAAAQAVSEARIKSGVYYLSEDPLPRRVLNFTLPGHTMSTLDEADAWLMEQFRNAGYSPKTDDTKVQAFGRDRSKPISQQYAPPVTGSPFYTAHNVLADKPGSSNPEELIIVIAHKDSQSWIESAGANDNAIGTVGALEVARVLAAYKPKHTIRFILCNEEHTPWTSVTAAEAVKASGMKVLALINMDGIGVKPPSQAGTMANVTRYTTPEGEKLADMMAMLNQHHSLGLKQSKYLSDSPGDDDGSFINAGFPWSVLNIGSMPYGDPNYHQPGDTPEKVDYRNAAITVQLTVAAVLHLDIYGRP